MPFRTFHLQGSVPDSWTPQQCQGSASMQRPTSRTSTSVAWHGWRCPIKPGYNYLHCALAKSLTKLPLQFAKFKTLRSYGPNRQLVRYPHLERLSAVLYSQDKQELGPAETLSCSEPCPGSCARLGHFGRIANSRKLPEAQ